MDKIKYKTHPLRPQINTPGTLKVTLMIRILSYDFKSAEQAIHPKQALTVAESGLETQKSTCKTEEFLAFTI